MRKEIIDMVTIERIYGSVKMGCYNDESNRTEGIVVIIGLPSTYIKHSTT